MFERGAVKVGHINCIECLKEAQLRWDSLTVLSLKEAQLRWDTLTVFSV